LGLAIVRSGTKYSQRGMDPDQDPKRCFQIMSFKLHSLPALLFRLMFCKYDTGSSVKLSKMLNTYCPPMLQVVRIHPLLPPMFTLVTTGMPHLRAASYLAPSGRGQMRCEVARTPFCLFSFLASTSWGIAPRCWISSLMNSLSLPW
jgi:hypothetical protein